MRLTRKNEAFFGGYRPLVSYAELCSKFGPLEDIEDELGVDLVTIFYALKDGIYTHYGFIRYVELSLLCDVWYFTNEEEGVAIPVETYGQFWSLTKEELV